MAYKPTGVSVPSAFIKRTSSGDRQQYPSDRLVEVVSVEPAADGNGTLTVLERTEFGTRRYIVRVNEDSLKRARNSEFSKNNNTASKFSGGLIDEKMKKEFKEGKTILILERTIFSGPKKTVNGEETYFLEAGWIHRATEVSPKKTFRGIFTLSTYENKVKFIQNWLPTISSEDDEGLKNLLNMLDENVKAFHDKKYPPGIGVQFRAIREVKDGDKLSYVVYDSSPPFDWVQKIQDETGTVVKEGHPLDGDKLEELLNGYLDYIYGPQDTQGQGKFDDEITNELIVEVMPYVNYTASNLNPRFTISPERKGDPLYRMANTPTKYAQDDDGYVTSKNWAVNGIVSLTGDKVTVDEETDQPVRIKRDMVASFYVNGFMGNLHNLVKAFDGNRAVVHDLLKGPTTTPSQDKGASASASTPASQGKQTASQETYSSSSTMAPPSQNTENMSLLQEPPATDFEDPFGDDNPFSDDPFAEPVESTVEEQKAEEVETPEPESHQEETKDESASSSSSTSSGRRRRG